jgi:hypothetical protein
MRLAFAASALCLSVSGLSLLTQAAEPVTPEVAATPATPATAASSAPVGGDAAAKHVKRTACIKEAKAKKLIGAEKTAFLKSCIEAPQEPISASRQIPPERP